MLDMLAVYWPYLLLALLAGVAVGWWSRDPRSIDDVTAWLQRSADEP
jgi:hypothetical protein